MLPDSVPSLITLWLQPYIVIKIDVTISGNTRIRTGVVRVPAAGKLIVIPDRLAIGEFTDVNIGPFCYNPRMKTPAYFGRCSHA